MAIERGASRETFSLWNLSGPELRHLNAQVRRFGPADLHGAPDHLLAMWPERPLRELADGALRALACKVVGRPPSREEWSFAVGVAEYRPFCPPLPER